MKKSLTLFFLLSLFFGHAQSWHNIPSPTQKTLHTVFFVDSTWGYIGGADSTLLHTTDGGKTWQQIALNLPFTTQFKDIVALWFANRDWGYALIGPYGDLFKTTDGTQTWTLVQAGQGSMCFKRSLYVQDSSNVFLGGASCFQGETLLRKENGQWGNELVIGTWDADDQISGFSFRNTQNGLASSTSSYLFKTTDGGQTWDSVSTPVDTLRLTDVQYVDDTLVYATYEQTGMEGILTSHDGGQSWFKDFALATFYYPGFNDILKLPKGHLFFGGQPGWSNWGIIFEAKKHAPWWNYVNMDHPVRELHYHSDSVVFAVGDSGLIACNYPPNTIGLTENKSLPLEVYPNPSHGTLHIQGIDEAQLQIIHSSGAFLEQRPIDGETTLNTTSWQPGVYFLKFTNLYGNRVVKVIVE